MYPVQERLIEKLKYEGDSLALVDIGRGTVQILQGFRTSMPAADGTTRATGAGWSHDSRGRKGI